jgi:hypothetical protein
MTRWPFSGWVVVVLDEVVEEASSDVEPGEVEVGASPARVPAVDVGPGSALANPQTAKAATPVKAPPTRITRTLTDRDTR